MLLVWVWLWGHKLFVRNKLSSWLNYITTLVCINRGWGQNEATREQIIFWHLQNFTKPKGRALKNWTTARLRRSKKIIRAQSTLSGTWSLAKTLRFIESALTFCFKWSKISRMFDFSTRVSTYLGLRNKLLLNNAKTWALIEDRRETFRLSFVLWFSHGPWLHRHWLAFETCNCSWSKLCRTKTTLLHATPI